MELILTKICSSSSSSSSQAQNKSSTYRNITQGCGLKIETLFNIQFMHTSAINGVIGIPNEIPSICS